MNTQNKIYILSTIFILASLCLILFSILPALKDIKNSSMEILSSDDSLTLVDREKAALNEFKNYKVDFDKIDRLLVNIDRPIDFIKFLEDTASATSLSLDKQVESSKKDGPFTTIVFSLDVAGSFSDVLNFTEKLEYGPYLVKINSLTIKKYSKADGGEVNFTQLTLAEILIEVATNEKNN